MPSDENPIKESTRAEVEDKLAQLGAQLRWYDEVAEQYLRQQTDRASRMNQFHQFIAVLESTVDALKDRLARTEQKAALLKTRMQELEMAKAETQEMVSAIEAGLA